MTSPIREEAIQDGEGVGELRFRDDQRRRQQDEVAANGKRDAGVPAAGDKDVSADALRPGRRGSRVAVLDEFQHGEQPVAAANLADHRVPGLERGELSEHQAPSVRERSMSRSSS